MTCLSFYCIYCQQRGTMQVAAITYSCPSQLIWQAGEGTDACTNGRFF